MNSTDAFPIGTRVTTSLHGPGTVTQSFASKYSPSWVTVQHDNGQTADWFTWAIKKVA